MHDERSRYSNATLSTLSHLCGLMANTLRAPGMRSLSFFCGLHAAADTSLQGGRGLMRAVALQLLDAFGDVAFPMSADPVIIGQRLASGDLDVTCSVFTMLLGALPVGAVYLFIDGAHWYDTEARAAETRAVVRFLNRVAGRMRAAPTGLDFKVLVTNPSPRQPRAWDIQAQEIYMEQHLLVGGNRGMEMHILASARPQSPV